MLVAARFVVVDAHTVLEDAAIRIRGGRVERVGRRSRLGAGRASSRERVIDVPDGVVLPGLVNAHVHLELSAIDGAPMRGSPFPEWLRFIVRERRSLEKPRALAALRVALAGAVRSGTTSFGEISSSGWSAPLLKRAGVRGVVFEETIAFDPARAAEAFSSLRTRLAAAGRSGSLVSPGVSPHAPYSVSPELMSRVLGLARRRRLPISVHAAETPEEREFVARGTGPLRDFLEELGVMPPGFRPPAPLARGRGPIELLSGLGLLRRGTILAHANDLARSDVARIARSGAAVVFCPGTHLYFGRPPHPLESLLRAGARAALGTDGRTSSDTLDLFTEMAAAARLFPRLRPEAIFDLATRGGAVALGLPRAGVLRPGASADLVVAGLEDGPRRARDVVPWLALRGPRRIELVLVAGRTPAAFAPKAPELP